MKSALIHLAILLAAFFFVSCEEKEAPQYDYSSAHRLGDICEAIAANDFDAVQAIAADNSAGVADDEFQNLVALLQDRHHQENDLRTAQRLLEAGEYDKLNDFIGQVENQGYATPELLRLRAIPQALMSLEMFKSRMPWQDAASLNLGITWLQPYLGTLNQSQVFRDFYDSQIKNLKTMK